MNMPTHLVAMVGHTGRPTTLSSVRPGLRNWGGRRVPREAQSDQGQQHQTGRRDDHVDRVQIGENSAREVTAEDQHRQCRADHGDPEDDTLEDPQTRAGEQVVR